MNSLKRYLQESINSLKSNVFRVILLVVGTTLSMIVAINAFIVKDTQEYCYRMPYEDYTEYDLRIDVKVDRQIFDELASLEEVNYLSGYKLVGLTEAISFYAVTANFLKNGCPSTSHSYSIVKPQGIMGRGFTQEDLLLKRDVVIISNSLAKSLRLKVGSYLHWEHRELKVVGILNDTPDILAKLYESSFKGKEINHKAYVLDFDNENFNTLIFNFKDDNLSKNFYKVKAILMKHSDKYMNLVNYDRYYIAEQIAASNYRQQRFILTVALSAVAVSILVSIMIMLFMLKDKISEIGIKRALGASVLDIVAQIWIEIILLLSLCMVLSSFLSIPILMLILPSIYLSAGVPINNLDVGMFFYPQILIFTITTIISLIPIIIICCSKITNTLKYE